MRRPILLAILTLPAAATAQERIRAGDFRAMSPQRIADALLPVGHAPIAGVVFDRMGDPRPPAPFVATISSVRFYSESTPIGADFCIQHEIVAEITPMPEADDALLGSPPRLVRETQGRQFYRYRPPGAACDGARPHFFIDGAPVEQGLNAFRALVRAVRQAEARTRKPLPFTVSCEGMACDSPRSVVRNLPYNDIVSLEFLRDDLVVRDGLNLVERMSGRVAIEFRLPVSGMTVTAIHATLFRTRVEKLAVQESTIVH
jgi:hypothetical protein